MSSPPLHTCLLSPHLSPLVFSTLISFLLTGPVHVYFTHCFTCSPASSECEHLDLLRSDVDIGNWVWTSWLQPLLLCTCNNLSPLFTFNFLQPLILQVCFSANAGRVSLLSFSFKTNFVHFLDSFCTNECRIPSSRDCGNISPIMISVFTPRGQPAFTHSAAAVLKNYKRFCFLTCVAAISQT